MDAELAEGAASLPTHFNTEGEFETEPIGETTSTTDLTTKTELKEAAIDEATNSQASRATKEVVAVRLTTARPTTPQAHVTDGAFSVRSRIEFVSACLP